MLAPYRGLVTRAYQRALRELDIDAGLRQALKAHERVPKFIDCLSDEFTKLASHRLKIGKPLPADRHLESMVKDITEIFIKGVQAKASQSYESEITRAMRKQETDRLRDLDSTIDGKASGDYADVISEGGVTTLDSRDYDGEGENEKENRASSR